MPVVVLEVWLELQLEEVGHGPEERAIVEKLKVLVGFLFVLLGNLLLFDRLRTSQLATHFQFILVLNILGDRFADGLHGRLLFEGLF